MAEREMKRARITKGHNYFAFYGHHKCATKWVLGIVHRLCIENGFRYLNFHKAGMFNNDLEGYLSNFKAAFFCYTNANIEQVKNINKTIKGFHIIRDPRDVIVSAYFSHLNSHPTDGWPELVEYRKRLRSLSKDEGISFMIDNIDDLHYEGEHVSVPGFMGNWDYEQPNVLELKYEDMVKEPDRYFLKIFGFLGILSDVRYSTINYLKHLSKKGLFYMLFPFGIAPSLELKVDRWRLLQLVHERDFKRLSKGRKQGQENMAHHYRKGTPGDWKNHFRQQHKRAFKKKYGDLLIRLGYEKNNNW